MIAKGLDFPRVTLVGAVLADSSLNLPDYRSAERSFQLLTQVAGRAGRADQPGHVVIQTYKPDHYAIVAAAGQDYRRFFTTEFERRRRDLYPPFTMLVRLLCQAKDEETARQVSGELLGKVEKLLALRLARVFFDVQETFVAGGLINSDLISVAFLAADSFCKPSATSSPDNVITCNVFMRRFVVFLAFLVNKIGLQSLLDMLAKKGLVSVFRDIVCSSSLHSNIAKMSGARAFQFLMLTKMLFEDFPVFQQLHMNKEFQCLLDACLENIWNRKKNFRGLATKSDDIREREDLDRISNNAFSNVHRLSVMDNPSKEYFDKFV